MKVKNLRTGEIIEAKRFKDMTEEERESTCIENECEDEDIFLKPKDGYYVWEYMLDHEVTILDELEED